MSQPRVTVLVPTHDGGALVGVAVESALRQTVADLEVLVVGDGAPDVTRQVVGEIVERDDRVRFLDSPKAPRRGELLRHAALWEHARGDVVLYLADDDVWFPDHVEAMLGALEDTDFASATSLMAQPDGTLLLRATDARHPEIRRSASHLEGGLGIGLSQAGHTAALYARLPHGWRTTPGRLPTDVYMWQQILSVPDVRVGRTARPTVVGLPDPPRRDWPPERRLAEQREWLDRVSDPERRARLLDDAWEAAIAFGTGQTAERRREQERLTHVRHKLDASQAKLRAERDARRQPATAGRRRRIWARIRRRDAEALSGGLAPASAEQHVAGQRDAPAETLARAGAR